MQPFMKNVAVEYAAKALPDSELKQALDTLQQAIDGKIGFDGRLDLIRIQGPTTKFQLSQDSIDYIMSTTDTRLVRSNSGEFGVIGYYGSKYVFLTVTINDNGIYLHQYSVPLDIQPNTDLSHSSVKYAGTKLYKHSIRISGSGYSISATYYSPIRSSAFITLNDLGSAIEGGNLWGGGSINGPTKPYITDLAYTCRSGWNIYVGPGYIRYRVNHGDLTIDTSTNVISFPAYETDMSPTLTDTVTEL